MSRQCRSTHHRATFAFATQLIASVALHGCDVPRISTGGPHCTRQIVGDLTMRRATKKVDILLVLDNSMGAEQQAIPILLTDVVREIIEPSYMDPIYDVHVGIITSSLGGLGSGACSDREEADDRGHLLGTR